MRFSQIIGLQAIKSTLIQAVENGHLAHAQLFLGKEGYAHLPLALAYATYINCSNKQNGDSCGKCPSCVKYDKYIHPDLHFVFPTASTKKISGKQAVSSAFMESWRKQLLSNPYVSLSDWLAHVGASDKQANISKEESRHIVRSLSLRAFEAPYKVMLIWLPEYMHPSAANAILKILEEPPPKTLFFLVSNQSERLLTTILSRTQIIHVPPFSDEEMMELLQQEHQAVAAKAQLAARLAEGNYNEAVRLVSEVADNSADAFKQWMRRCFMLDFTAMIQQAEEFQRMGKEAQKGLLQYGLTTMRESLVSKSQALDLQRVSEQDAVFVQKFAQTLKPHQIPALVQELNQAQIHLERNANPKLLFLHLSLQIGRIFRKG